MVAQEINDLHYAFMTICYGPDFVSALALLYAQFESLGVHPLNHLNIITFISLFGNPSLLAQIPFLKHF